MITETDGLSAALDAAAAMWPEHAGQRGHLLRLVLELGIEQVIGTGQLRRESRLEAIRAAAGSLENVWPENWREELAGEWPR
jgi:hypothetical protein